MTKQTELEKEPVVNGLDFLLGMDLTFPEAGNAAVDSPQLSASVGDCSAKGSLFLKVMSSSQTGQPGGIKAHPLVPSWDNSEQPAWFQSSLESDWGIVTASQLYFSLCPILPSLPQVLI